LTELTFSRATADRVGRSELLQHLSKGSLVPCQLKLKCHL